MNIVLPPALVLTAGLGTRLAPLSAVRAKPAVPVAGTPLVLRILQWLASQGIYSVVLNLHHKPETITRWVGHGTDSGLTVRYSWEPRILGTAGGPCKALALLGQRFFIINGDTLADLALDALFRAHNDNDADVTLALTATSTPQRYGGVVVDGTGCVTGFAPSGTRVGHHFVGVQLVEASVFSGIREGEPAASIGGVYDQLLQRHARAIQAHWVSVPFRDVGTPEDYLATSLSIAESEGLRTLPIGEGSEIHPSASLTRTAVWNDVVIEAGCRLIDCVVADGVRLPQGSAYERQVIVAAGGRALAGDEDRGGAPLLAPLGASDIRLLPGSGPNR